MQPNRAELARLRGKTDSQALALWVEHFGEGDPGLAARYAQVASSFLYGEEESGSVPYIGKLSPATRASYAYAITEFFEWAARKHGRVVPPHQVTRKDAEDYAAWLATRPFSLEAERLRDGDTPDRLALYELVKKLGGADIGTIAAELPVAVKRAHPDPQGTAPLDMTWLGHELGRMVLHDLLVRAPTMDELRKENPNIGITVFTVDVPQGDRLVPMPLASIFQYQVPKPRAVSRVTIALRLAALSSFWDALTDGENTTGRGVIEFNIWKNVLHRVRRGLESERRAARARAGRLTPQLVERLLLAADGPSLEKKRDAALLWFLVLTGSRVSAALQLRRGRPDVADEKRWLGWLDDRSDPAVVELVLKGGKRQRLPYPPYALRALAVFQAELDRLAPPVGAQWSDPRAPGYIPRGSIRWRYRELSREQDAPLFPAISFWGANTRSNYEPLKPNPIDYRKPMSRVGVYKILKRIARRAGFTDEELALVHGHTFRHFAATAMSKQGKPIREIQAILGHESIVTTEGYLEEITSPAALSGQNEILDYISGATPREPPAPPGDMPAREPPKPVIRTYGVRTDERPVEAPRVVTPKSEPPPKEGLVEVSGGDVPAAFDVRNGVSAGSPFYAYEAFDPDRKLAKEPLHFTMVEPRSARTRKAATLYEKRGKDMVQQEKWLREHYDPWPLSYGLGEASLLPWFARGSASKTGEVTVEIRGKSGERKAAVVPPLPVLAPEQLYSEVKGQTLWALVQAKREEWIASAPTKAFGLDRWWGAFQEIQRGLADGTHGKFPWVPFAAPGTVGKNIRAHDDEYIATWLEKNADRYTTTVRAFEHIERPRGGPREEEEWTAFREQFARASLIGVSPAEELPEWFTADDPVKEIYDKSPEEFSWFAKWLGAITGQKLTKTRKDERTEQKHFAEEARTARIETARELLRGYFEIVASLRNATVRGDREEADRERVHLKVLTDRLAEYGVPDPKEEQKGMPRSLDARIETLLREAFPEADVELIDANVLRSDLFDTETFRLDTGKHTVVHTAEFRKAFADMYDGRDSECIARRAARGMWEHVKRHGIPVKQRGTERSSEYSLLYSVMLSYMAWIVPCPAAIERRMADATDGAFTGARARARYLSGFRAASARILRTDTDLDERALQLLVQEEGLDEAGAAEVLEAALVQDSVRAETALPSQPVAEAIARTAVTSGHVAVLRRKRPAVVVTRPAAAAAPERRAGASLPELRAPGRARVVELPAVPSTYLSVGPDEEDEEDLTPNRPPHRYLTPNAYQAGVRRVAELEAIMPSGLAMMAAMTLRF